MKVLFVSHTANVGCGAENCLINLLGRLVEFPFELIVAVPNGGGPMEDVLKDLGIACVRTPLEWWIGSTKQLDRFSHGFELRLQTMAELIGTYEIDLVVTNTSVVLEGACGAAMRGIPHVWYVHEMLSVDPYLQTPYGAASAYTFINDLSAVIVTVSQAVQNEIRSLCPEANVKVVYTGLDVRCQERKESCRDMVIRQTGFPESSIIACFVGVLSKRKGVMQLIDVARLLRDRHATLRYLIVGPDGGMEESFKAAMQKHDLEGIIYLAGATDNALPWINGADIFMLPSLADPFPLVLHEAMHLGIPIVATHSGGASEIVQDEITGFLTSVGNAEAFAEAVLRLAREKPLRKMFGERGACRAEKDFSSTSYANGFQALLNKQYAAASKEAPLETFLNNALKKVVRKCD